MKKIINLLMLFLLALPGMAQQKTKISGKLLNCKDRQLELTPSTGNFKDSIMINADGSFSYETDKIKSPFRANLTNRKQIQIQLFLAPGYDLQITADVSDYETARSSIKYAGKGGANNHYWEKRPIDTLKRVPKDTVNWMKKDEDTYIAYLKRTKSTSHIDQVFGPDNTDPYRDYFKRSLQLDQKFGDLISIMDYYTYQHKYTPEQTDRMINRLGLGNMNDVLNRKENLASSNFCYVINYIYPYHAKARDQVTDEKANPAIPNYSLFKIAQLYKGAVYDFVFEDKLNRNLDFIYKVTELEKYKPYILKVQNTEVRKKLLATYDKKLKSSSFLRIGGPAPYFNLPDTSGVLHSLAGLKGKVVYIDLWASWCGPCREENPHMQKLYENYQHNPKLAIISIAVNDLKTRKNRYAILKENKPLWLQLEDQNDVVLKDYTANSIPRFILINKEGKIVDADAPRPSNLDVLSTLLDKELAK
ncbi:TlpA disulfide reductase family protein [Pedobacter frigoris]|uniref:TlpA family protein disulfide reductase n=1 Tax=Pedobacter frigoris TaxID=2571272 RepID=UPI00292D4922|nr:TlpA disulfide reductase family protein [Pedobacter frigoris]